MRYQGLTRTLAETDRKLLLFIIQKADIKIDYAGAAAMMSTGDIKCTENAIQKRMGRLRELAKATSGYVKFTLPAPLVYLIIRFLSIALYFALQVQLYSSS